MQQSRNYGRCEVAPNQALQTDKGNLSCLLHSTSSWLIEGNELLVNTYGGGSIVVDGDGALRMAECVSEQTSE